MDTHPPRDPHPPESQVPPPTPPEMSVDTAAEVTAAQREAYERARRAAHAPRSASSKKGLLYAYLGMAVAVVVLVVAGALISGFQGAMLGFVGGIIIVAVGSVPIWMAVGSYNRERKTGRRL
jgi:hypothetical protein